MKKNIKTVFIFSLSLFIICLPLISLAQSNQPPVTIGVRLQNPFACGTGPCTLLGLITAILNNIVMPIAVVAVVIWIVWAGFGFLTAQGKEAEIRKARERLQWSLIGAAILLGAAGIAAVLENTVRALVNIP